MHEPYNTGRLSARKLPPLVPGSGSMSQRSMTKSGSGQSKSTPEESKTETFQNGSDRNAMEASNTFAQAEMTTTEQKF